MKLDKFLFAFALLLAAPAFAQTNGQTNGTGSTIIIEGVSDAEPDPEKEIRVNKLKKRLGEVQKMEKSAKKEKVEDDHRFVQDTLRRTGPLIHGLQRYARGSVDVLPLWRAGIRYQAAAHEAFRQRKYHSAVYLTLKARDFAREGYQEANVTLAGKVEDTRKEKDYASKSSDSAVQLYVEAAYKVLPDSELDPGKSPHKWRTNPYLGD